MPINVHTQFFFPAGDLGSKHRPPRACPSSASGPRSLGLDVEAGSFPVILAKMITIGGLRALPRPQVRRLRGPHRLGALLPRALRRVGPAQPAPSGRLPLLPSEYFRRNVSVVYIVDEMGAANRYDIGVGNIMWGPDFPHSSSSWPVDYQLGPRDPRAGRRHAERDRADHVAERRGHLQDALRRAGHRRRRRVGARH